MRDPDEGLDNSGNIVTGARRDRVPAAYEPVLREACDLWGDGVSLYLYGSVATGQAVPGRSDVDLLAIGADRCQARDLGDLLTRRFADLARGVSIGVARGFPVGEGEEAYGNRVFLRHYCVPIVGPDPASMLTAFRGDIVAARGFNGDFPGLIGSWQEAVGQREPAELARRVARKTLFAVAGLVSVHDTTWTTDRVTAANRWGALNPHLGSDLETLHRWAEGAQAPTSAELQAALGGIVTHIAQDFVTTIGVWSGL